jgi:hypothetical protein
LAGSIFWPPPPFSRLSELAGALNWEPATAGFGSGASCLFMFSCAFLTNALSDRVGTVTLMKAGIQDYSYQSVNLNITKLRIA